MWDTNLPPDSVTTIVFHVASLLSSCLSLVGTLFYIYAFVFVRRQRLWRGSRSVSLQVPRSPGPARATNSQQSDIYDNSNAYQGHHPQHGSIARLILFLVVCDFFIALNWIAQNVVFVVYMEMGNSTPTKHVRSTPPSLDYDYGSPSALSNERWTSSPASFESLPDGSMHEYRHHSQYDFGGDPFIPINSSSHDSWRLYDYQPCNIMAPILLFFIFASLLWTASFATETLLRLMNSNRSFFGNVSMSNTFPFWRECLYHLLVWGISLVLIIDPIVESAIDTDTYYDNGITCAMAAIQTRETFILLGMVVGTLIYCGFTYSLMNFMRYCKAEEMDMDFTGKERVRARRFTRQIALYLLVFIITWIWTAALIILHIFNIRRHIVNWILSILSDFFLPLNGFLNALVYGSSNNLWQDVRLHGRVMMKRCGSCLRWLMCGFWLRPRPVSMQEMTSEPTADEAELLHDYEEYQETDSEMD